MVPTSQKTMTVRLPYELAEEVREIAVAHDRSLSAELRVALAAYVRREGPGARRILGEGERT